MNFAWRIKTHPAAACLAIFGHDNGPVGFIFIISYLCAFWCITSKNIRKNYRKNKAFFWITTMMGKRTEALNAKFGVKFGAGFSTNGALKRAPSQCHSVNVVLAIYKLPVAQALHMLKKNYESTS